MKKRLIVVFVLLFLMFGLVGCGSSSSSSSSSSGSTNRCGDTTDEHYAKTRACNAKDSATKNCTYSNCSCTCKSR